MQGGFSDDRLDTAASNMVGAAAGVLIACVLCNTISWCRQLYGYRLTKQDGKEHSKGYNCLFSVMSCFVKVYFRLGLNRKSDIQKLQMEKNITVQQEELNDPAHPRNRIDLDWETENLFLETLVGAQDVNIWSILMPAVYQLVPGSIIAKLWYHSIFQRENASNVDPQENVFSSLMVTSTSLAIGLIFGFAITQSYSSVYGYFCELCWKGKEDEDHAEARKRRHMMMDGMYTAGNSKDDDPKSSLLERQTGARSFGPSSPTVPSMPP